MPSGPDAMRRQRAAKTERQRVRGTGFVFSLSACKRPTGEGTKVWGLQSTLPTLVRTQGLPPVIDANPSTGTPEPNVGIHIRWGIIQIQRPRPCIRLIIPIAATQERAAFFLTFVPLSDILSRQHEFSQMMENYFPEELAGTDFLCQPDNNRPISSSLSAAKPY